MSTSTALLSSIAALRFSTISREIGRHQHASHLPVASSREQDTPAAFSCGFADLQASQKGEPSGAGAFHRIFGPCRVDFSP